MFEEECKNIVIKHVKGSTSKYELSFKIKPLTAADEAEGFKSPDTRENAIFLAEGIVDPDEDGNYPLDGELVSGRLIESSLVYKPGKGAKKTAKKAAKELKKTAKASPKKTEKKGRCPNGSKRIPPKTGDCVSHSTGSKPKTKRAQRIMKNMKRRSQEKESQEKEKEKEKESPSTKSRQAKYYDIAEELTPDYYNILEIRQDGKNFQEKFRKKVQDYVDNHSNIKVGDLLFVGSPTETRQYYGWAIVGPNHKVVYNDDLLSMPLKYAEELKKEGVRYNDFFEEIMKDEDLNELVYGYGYPDVQDDLQEFKNKGIA
jgi:hypothetical protein